MPANVLIAVNRELFPTLFSKMDLDRLHGIARVLPVEPPVDADRDFLLEHAGEADVVISSWGTARVDAEVLAKADRLKLVCHAAGSVRPVVSEALWERKVRVTSSAAAIAYGVAEFTLGLLLSCSKRVPWFGVGTRQGYWQEPQASFGGAFEIYQQNIGIIGAGHIGRILIRLLKSFTCQVLVYDPYLSAGEAEKLGVRKVDELEELFSTCRAVTLHAPTHENTRHMLRGHHFAALQKGSLFINTAGSIQIHEEEFLAELRKGNFVACIDRCNLEPVEQDHPYRHLPNVLLTPHIAGVIAENRLRIGTMVVDEIEQLINGGAFFHEVTLEDLAKMA
ncbi:MAG TPA: hydroxyacid dehydrogenase [Chthoniobacteraceae bacterium]|nr:hydroxyacid dehydrogenase [Chthoniobacteraceae bacterium]